jgi:hypothetical protein
MTTNVVFFLGEVYRLNSIDGIKNKQKKRIASSRIFNVEAHLRKGENCSYRGPLY